MSSGIFTDDEIYWIISFMISSYVNFERGHSNFFAFFGLPQAKSRFQAEGRSLPGGAGIRPVWRPTRDTVPCGCHLRLGDSTALGTA